MKTLKGNKDMNEKQFIDEILTHMNESIKDHSPKNATAIQIFREINTDFDINKINELCKENNISLTLSSEDKYYKNKFKNQTLWIFTKYIV